MAEKQGGNARDLTNVKTGINIILMKRTYKLLGIAATAVTGAILEVRRRRSLRRLLNAANEGYETAHDIIYPRKNKSSGDKNLRYGPVY